MNDDVIEVSTVHSWTRRKKMLLLASFVSVVLVLITIAGALMPEESYAINYGNKYAEPSLQYIFGTDHMGRDMLYRCIKGLSISIQVGLLAAQFLYSIGARNFICYLWWKSRCLYLVAC